MFLSNSVHAGLRTVSGDIIQAKKLSAYTLFTEAYELFTYATRNDADRRDRNVPYMRFHTDRPCRTVDGER